MLVCTGSTAEVERGFSLYKVIKSRLRNKLETMTMDALLRVKMLAPANLLSSAGRPFFDAVASNVHLAW